MGPGLLFTFCLVALLLVINALRSPKPPEHRLPPLWLPAMLASEAAGVWLVTTPAVVALVLAGGVGSSPVGFAGAALGVAATLGQAEVWRRSRMARRLLPPPVDLPKSRVARALSLPAGISPGVVLATHTYAENPHGIGQLDLDLYLPGDAVGPLPVVVYLHGGGWRGGSRSRTGRVALQHLAERGWAVAAIDYPLSPAATFPEHLAGLDLAMSWLGSRDGLSATRVVMGGSAGAHLAAVAALTREDIDGMVGLYGIYDLLNRNRIRVDWPLIPRHVMKVDRVSDPEAYRRASPLDLVHPGAPPTLIIHGSQDSLVPPQEGRQFAEALTTAGAKAEYLEVPWAQHAFDVLAGGRSRSVAGYIATWLETEVLAPPEMEADIVAEL
jgi:acetyl esterase/lipase